MRWVEAKVIFEFENKELAADLIANIFHEFGLQGVVIEAPKAFEPDDWADTAAALPEHDAVIGYFPEDRKAEPRCRALEGNLPHLRQAGDLVYQESVAAVLQRALPIGRSRGLVCRRQSHPRPRRVWRDTVRSRRLGVPQQV